MCPLVGRRPFWLGVDDSERAVIAAYGMNGKRLTYRRTGQAKNT